jgi:hypothetical protein
MAHKPGPLSRLPLDTARVNTATSEKLGVVAEPACPTRDMPAFGGEPSGRHAPSLFWLKENREEFSRMPATVHTPMRNVPFPEFLPSQAKISNQAVPGQITGLQQSGRAEDPNLLLALPLTFRRLRASRVTPCLPRQILLCCVDVLRRSPSLTKTSRLTGPGRSPTSDARRTGMGLGCSRTAGVIARAIPSRSASCDLPSARF